FRANRGLAFRGGSTWSPPIRRLARLAYSAGWSAAPRTRAKGSTSTQRWRPMHDGTSARWWPTRSPEPGLDREPADRHRPEHSESKGRASEPVDDRGSTDDPWRSDYAGVGTG